MYTISREAFDTNFVSFLQSKFVGFRNLSKSNSENKLKSVKKLHKKYLILHKEVTWHINIKSNILIEVLVKGKT